MNGGSGADRTVDKSSLEIISRRRVTLCASSKKSRSAASLAENRQLRGEAPSDRLIIHFMKPFMNNYSFSTCVCDSTKAIYAYETRALNRSNRIKSLLLLHLLQIDNWLAALWGLLRALHQYAPVVGNGHLAV